MSKKFTKSDIHFTAKTIFERFFCFLKTFEIPLLFIIIGLGFVALILYTLNLYQKEYHIFLIEYIFIILLIPLFLVFFSKKILILLYEIIFSYKYIDVKNHDFYTNSNDFLKHIKDKNRGVYFFILPLIKNSDDNFDKIKRSFEKLISFWYTSEFDKVKLRFFLPLLSISFSIISFIITLYLLDNADMSNVGKMTFATIFLLVLYLCMLYHINIFLDPLYYMKDIDRHFKSSNINFPKQSQKQSQKIMLFMNKVFLFKINDKDMDRMIDLNTSEEFENFIHRSKMDKKGRDLLIQIFISVFMVIYLTIFVEVLVDDYADEFIKKNEQNITKMMRN